MTCPIYDLIIPLILLWLLYGGHWVEWFFRSWWKKCFHENRLCIICLNMVPNIISLSSKLYFIKNIYIWALAIKSAESLRLGRGRRCSPHSRSPGRRSGCQCRPGSLDLRLRWCRRWSPTLSANQRSVSRSVWTNQRAVSRSRQSFFSISKGQIHVVFLRDSRQFCPGKRWY